LRSATVFSDISARTVEVHKARLMTKLEARNVSELVHFVFAAEKG
jgi:DNA-binding CsgD family transcriptional regulator